MSRIRWCACAAGSAITSILEFEPGESFVTLGGGDLAGLTYGAYGNHLVLKPKAPTVRTNLTVFTNKRTYVIDYAVSSGRPDPVHRRARLLVAV